MNKEEFAALHGFVYLLRCGDQYKIGYSKSPLKRLRQLRTGSPHPVTLVHTLRTIYYKQIEEKLHYQFASKRGRGEWFALADADVEVIKSLDKWGYTPEEAKQREVDRQEADAKHEAAQVAENNRRLAVLSSGIASGWGVAV